MNKADVNCYKKKEKFLGRGNHSPQTATGAWWLVLFNTEPIFFSCRSRGSFLFGFPRCNVLWNCVGQQSASKKLVLDWINIRCCNDITKWAQSRTQSDWKLSKLHLLLFERADDGPTEEWRDEARKTELITSSHRLLLKRKKGRHFSFWKESFALACSKRASIVNIVQCRPWMRIWFWIWCTVFFLALAKQTKIGFRSIHKPMWQELCDKKSKRMFKCSKENETNL